MDSVSDQLNFVMNQKLKIMKKFSIALATIILTSVFFLSLNKSKNMREIKTEITINASVEQVWETFINVEKYKTWNPFIKSLTGNLEVGNQITVLLQPPGGRQMTFKPKVLVFDKNKEFRWLGKILVKGIFDGEHYFQFIDNQNGTTTFIHGEKFNGVLVRFVGNILDSSKISFELMNDALKKEVEKTEV